MAKDVLKMFDNDEIGFDIAMRLLKDLRKGVHWCDGNEYEATECMYGVRCGHCLRLNDEIIDAFDEMHVGCATGASDLVRKFTLTGEVCPECLAELKANWPAE